MRSNPHSKLIVTLLRGSYSIERLLNSSILSIRFECYMTESMVLRSSFIIDGNGGQPIRDGAILVEKGMIVKIGPRDAVRVPNGAEVVDLEDQTLLPGLIEPHQHFLAMDDRHYGDKIKDPEAYKALWAARCAREDMRSGVTTIRLMGSHGWWSFAFKKAIEDDVIAGPRLLNAGRGVKALDGHGFMGTPVSGIEEIRRVLRENFAMGADCVKIFISGGAHSPTGLMTSYFSREEIVAAVDEAHRHGVKIGAHAYGSIGATWFIEAGGDSIEHGGALTEEQMDLMVRKGTYLSITQPGGDPPYIKDVSVSWLTKDRKLQAVMEQRKKMVSEEEVCMRAVKKGVKFTTNQDIHFGGLPWNITSLVKRYGISPMRAILANTKSAAECCGILDKVGTLEPGKCADIISVKGNPLEEISNIQRADMVMKGGRIYDPIRGYWKGLEDRGFLGLVQ